MLDYAEAVDDTTVLFHMTTPFSIWPYTMAIVGIVPEHAYDSATYGANPIGSGRYLLKQWDRGQQVILEANPDYYGAAPKCAGWSSSLWRRTPLFWRPRQERWMWPTRLPPTRTSRWRLQPCLLRQCGQPGL